MSILKILHYPDHRLRKIAHPVIAMSKNTQKIIHNMFETMYFYEGIGLAAPQVNINQQIIVIDLHQKEQKRLVLINPIIINKTGKTSINEGCLSIPTIYETIPRSKTILIRSLNEKGNTFEMEANDLLSICIQHEIDHLIGKLFIDYLTPLKIHEIHKKIIKLYTTNNK